MHYVVCSDKLDHLNTGSMDPSGHKRGRRKDHAAQENGEASSSSDGDEFDPWTAWAFKPHTISFLLIGACFLM